MERFYIFDNKNTFSDWNMILTDSTIAPPEIKTNYIDIDGMSGSLDLTEALTGEITYNDRTISMSFLTDYGTREDRTVLLHKIRQFLHGRKLKIIEPDDPTHYFYGRVKIKDETNLLTYSTLSIEAICDPWRYLAEESKRFINISGNTISKIVFRNNGIKTICPDIIVSGSVSIYYDDTTISLNDGSYKIADIKLYPGVTTVGVSGNGSIIFSYREATL